MALENDQEAEGEVSERRRRRYPTPGQNTARALGRYLVIYLCILVAAFMLAWAANYFSER